MYSSARKVQDTASVLVAVILIAIGVLFLLDQLLHIALMSYLWPFVIIVPGVLLFMYALTLDGAEGDGLAVFSSVLTVAGLLLLFQNTTGLWATWAYAWALIAPTSVGLGLMLYGSLKGRADWVTSGRIVAKVGIGLFLGFGAFFELLLNISGVRFGAWIVPLALIALGLYVVWKTARAR